MAAQGIAIEHLDLGGGLGIRYTDEVPPSPKTLLDEVSRACRRVATAICTWCWSRAARWSAMPASC